MQIWQLSLWLAETNAYVVSADGPGSECVLIDAPPDPAAILGVLGEHGLRLVALLSTHGHLDHVGGVSSVLGGLDPGPERPRRAESTGPERPRKAEGTGPERPRKAEGTGPERPRRAEGTGRSVPVHIHDEDRHMLLDPVGTGGDFGRYLEQEHLDLTPPELIEGLEDGQVVRGGGLAFTAIHTPGHTRGSVCFRLDADGEAPLLFTGDHLFAGSIGRTDLPGGSMEELVVSMREKILPLDDDLAVLPGHGGRTTIGAERRTNPFVLQMTGG